MAFSIVPADIRDLLDLGPPDGFYTRFLKVFGDKISNTQKEVEAVLAELGTKIKTKN